MFQSKILIYIVIGLLSLVSLSSVFKNVKDTFFPTEKTYSLEAVKLMIKHDRLIQKDKELEIEYEIMEKDNERLKNDKTADSTVIFNSSRAYRDSLRAELFK
jgi:hypothetical protein